MLQCTASKTYIFGSFSHTCHPKGLSCKANICYPWWCIDLRASPSFVKKYFYSRLVLKAIKVTWIIPLTFLRTCTVELSTARFFLKPGLISLVRIWIGKFSELRHWVTFSTFMCLSLASNDVKMTTKIEAFRNDLNRILLNLTTESVRFSIQSSIYNGNFFEKSLIDRKRKLPSFLQFIRSWWLLIHYN